MTRYLLLAGAAASIAASPSPPQQAAHPAAQAQPAARLPSFAAELSEAPPITTATSWAILSDADGWAALAAATPETRQAARWAYARSLIGKQRFGEAFGVLEVMLQDDPDLALVPTYQLARGAALAGLKRPDEALTALNSTGLSDNAEACAWRMLALRQGALSQVNCALPALRSRSVSQATPFLLAASGAAINAGKPMLALEWMQQIPDRSPAANLLRGCAYLALGEMQEARLRFARVERSGSPEEKMEARLSLVEAEARQEGASAGDAVRKLAALRFVWRGGPVEERALRLSYTLAQRANDLPATLSAGATLVRYFDLTPADAGILPRLQNLLLMALDPRANLPLDRAAGLYWEYRDLTPPGAQGDYLVSRFADRLQAAGLYNRAAELLEHQLFQRTRDVAQGPLSAKVGTLYILAGKPDEALRVLRSTGGNRYPEEMIWARSRVEAIALTQLGKANEALAILQDVPGSAGIQAEIAWRKKDWASLAAGPLPSGPQIGEVDQALILRHAIALAMLGREGELASLRSRFGRIFARLPSGASFDLLTRPAAAIDEGAIDRAIAAMPAASPAGDYADLLDTTPVKAGPVS